MRRLLWPSTLASLRKGCCLLNSFSDGKAAPNAAVVYVSEIPRSNGMEYGAILPDLGHEAEWLAQLGLANRYA
jgi:hypothetical protein